MTSVGETMARLSGKPNVKATMVLDRALNTILQTSGSFASFRPVDAPRNSVSTAPGNDTISTKEEGTEEFAMMISKFVHSAGGLVQDLDTEDDMKLLRLRTKKHELVIVPDAKYIFVVVHDTPPA